MSAENVREIIRKAVVDEDFRAQLLDNAEDAVSNYDLAEEEIAGLRRLTDEAFADDAGTLEERVSRGIKLN